MHFSQSGVVAPPFCALAAVLATAVYVFDRITDVLAILPNAKDRVLREEICQLFRPARFVYSRWL
jgi:hypothetical protein